MGLGTASRREVLPGVMYRRGWYTWEHDLARGGDRFLLRGFPFDGKSFRSEP